MLKIEALNTGGHDRLWQPYCICVVERGVILWTPEADLECPIQKLMLSSSPAPLSLSLVAALGM